MRIILYLVAIIAANVITARFAPVKLGVFIIPWGTLLIGCTFILRDLVQNKLGRTRTYIVIVSALVLSAVSSYLLGDTLWIVFASAISFLVSESMDTEIYTRLHTSMSAKILFSGIVSGLFDSSIFVIVGLSPIGANFVPWDLVWMAILGQMMVKTAIQFIGYAPFKLYELSK